MPLPTYLMSNFPSVRPSLNLQFDSQPTPEDMTSHLASVGATFSRASIGTYTDANGLIQEASAGQARPNYSSAGVHEGLLIEESRTNVVVNSENFNVYSAIYQTTISAGLEIAPNGKGNSTLVSNTTDNNIHGFAINDGGITSGTVYTLSLFVKKGSSRYFKLKSNNTTTLAIDVTFDLNDGSVDTESFGTGSTQSFSNGWYRLSATGTCGVSGSTSVGIRILNDSKQETYTGVTTENVYVWGLQLEEGSFPTSYIPTIPTFSSRASTATYFDSSGVLQTASIDEARTDHKYIDGQWIEAGLLLEAEATNLFTDSRPHNWTKNSGCTSSTTTFPIGSDTASVLTHDGTNSDPYFVRGAGSGAVLENRTFTFSAYIWSISGSANITLFIYDNSIGNVFSKSITLTTTPQLYSLTVTFPSGETDTNFNCRFDLSNTAQSIGVFQAQAEEGSVATSRIPTTSAQVTRSADVYTTATKTRSADVCYIDGTAFTDFYNQDAGTIFIDFTIDNLPPSGFVNLSQIGGGFFIEDDGQIGFRGGLTSTQFSAGNIKASYKYTNSQANFDIFVNGGNKTTATGSQLSPTSAHIAQSASNNKQINGGVKKFIYFPRALSDNELIKLTQ